jgi:hypothetical protein
MEYSGDFETHITVVATDDGQIPALRKWAADHGLKCLHIVLDRGLTRSQPMLTRHGRGTLSEQRTAANNVYEALMAAGFSVSRIKVEAAPENEDVPQTNDTARNQSPGAYFEHHVKLLLRRGADLQSLRSVAQRHGAHVSRNALQQFVDGNEQRFVTQQCRSVGRHAARQELDRLLAALKELAHPILDVEEEFVVYDSNPAVDAGWLRVEE